MTHFNDSCYFFIFFSRLAFQPTPLLWLLLLLLLLISSSMADEIKRGRGVFFFGLFFLEMNHCLPRQGPPSLRCTHRVDIIDDIVEVGTGDYLFFSALFANFASSVSLVDGSFFLLKQKKNFFLDRQWNPACENVPERFRRFFDLI